MKLNGLKKKKILILGLGREGRDNFRFLRKLFPKKVLGVGDRLELNELNEKAKKLIEGEKRSRSIRLHLGKNYLKSLKKYDIVFKSPGIPFKILSRSDLNKITSQTEIFFENCPGKIIGITGTKGKSTTASLIYKILRGGGIKAHLVGNIGKPVLSLLFKAGPNEVYVYELSSHQLYNLKKSPQVAVFLNVYPEHLDYYRDFNEYLQAKANITRFQSKRDYLIYNSQDKLVKEIARKSKAKKVPIKGEYYALDREAAKAVGKILKIPPEIIQKAIREFHYLPHRLELVGTYRGITFYNDALATIPEATIAAITALGKKVETIMLGGFERNLDFTKLAKKVLESKIKNVILFPTTGERIWKKILRCSVQGGGKFSLPENFFVDNMEEAVRIAYRQTRKGKICLLSTASPSFSIFKDYKEKGNLFKKYVKKFAQ